MAPPLHLAYPHVIERSTRALSRMSALAVLIAVVVPASVLSAHERKPRTAEEPRLAITGNRVLLQDVYLAVAALPKDAAIDEKTAATVRARVLGFLRRSGYVLAKVTAHVEDDMIVLSIDEGQLDKIIYPGLGGFSTLRMRLELDMPHDVFNEPHLERQLKELSSRRRLRSIQWTLVRTASVVHEGPQLEDSPELVEAGIIPEPGIYELRIDVEDSPWRQGLSPEIDYESPDGLHFGAKYRFGEMIFDEERWLVRTVIGMRVQDLLAESKGRRFFSRSTVEVAYSTPALEAGAMRGVLSLSGSLLNRQRLDLGVQSFDLLLIDPSLRLVVERIEWLSLSAGVGLQYMKVLSFEDGAMPLERVEPLERPRPVILGTIEVIFDPSNLRDDRRHRVRLDSELHLRAGGFGKVAVEYSRAFLFGWNELRIEGGGGYLWGRVAYTDEISIGDHLRGVFGNDSFTQKALGASGEFRLSLSRDYLKVGIFHDLVLFAARDRRLGVDAPEQARLANSFGLGVHLLLEDAYQLSVYGAVGFTLNRQDAGVSLSLSQAF